MGAREWIDGLKEENTKGGVTLRANGINRVEVETGSWGAWWGLKYPKPACQAVENQIQAASLSDQVNPKRVTVTSLLLYRQRGSKRPVSPRGAQKRSHSLISTWKSFLGKTAVFEGLGAVCVNREKVSSSGV